MTSVIDHSASDQKSAAPPHGDVVLAPHERVAATSDRFMGSFVNFWIFAAIVIWLFEIVATPTVQYPGIFALIVGVAARLVIRSVRIRLARLVIIVPWLMFTLCAPAFVNGVRTPVLINIPMLMLLTGWMLGRRALLLVAAILLSGVTLYWLAEAHGWFVMAMPLRSADIWFTTWFTDTAGTCIVIWFLLKNYEVNFSKETELQQQLRESLKFNEAILLNSPLPMAVYAAGGRCVEANDALAALVGTTRDVLLTENFHSIKTWKTYGLFDACLAALAQNNAQRGEAHFVTSFGQEIFVEFRVLPTPLVGENHLLVQFVDLTERKQREEELRNFAFQDALTQLPNRRLLLDRIAQAVHASKRQNSHAALLFLDLNRFKALNDAYGHDAGDQLLIEVAMRLKREVRETDTVARIGGDEFVVLLEGLGTESGQAQKFVESVTRKIRRALNQEYVLGEIRHQCSASIGVTLFFGEGDPDHILRDADAAMYATKRAEVR